MESRLIRVNWSCHFLVVTNKVINTTTPYLSSILNIVADPESLETILASKGVKPHSVIYSHLTSSEFRLQFRLTSATPQSLKARSQADIKYSLSDVSEFFFDFKIPSIMAYSSL